MKILLILLAFLFSCSAPIIDNREYVYFDNHIYLKITDNSGTHYLHAPGCPCQKVKRTNNLKYEVGI